MVQNCEELVNWLKSFFTPTEDLLDKIYPVGSIYMTMDSSNPSTLFGGTWERIDNKFLLGSENGQGVGSTGGSKDAVVVQHTHSQNSHSHTASKKFMVTNSDVHINETKRTLPATGNAGYMVYASSPSGGINEVTSTNATTATNQVTGESGIGKNMPPFITVNIWKRTE